MKIHYVAPHFHPELGGVEDHVLRLGKYMVSRGHEVTVHTSQVSFAGGTLSPQEEIHGILVRRYRPSIRLGYYATRFKPRIGAGDVLHAHGYAFLPNDFAIRHYRGRMGTVFTMHHGVRMTPPNFRGRLLRSLYDFYGLRTLKLADRVLTSTEADRGWLATRKVSQDKISVVPDGIDDEAFVRGDSGAAGRYGLSSYLMFLGRVHQEKCIDHLLQAFARLKRPDLQVAVVGPYAGALGGLRRISNSLGIESAVRFLGRVPPEDKRGLLTGCLMLVLPSLYEAQGLVILEAWAQARPVVASRVGGVPFMVSDGVNGLLYDWGDIGQLSASITRLLNDRSLAARIGEAGWKTASERYRWSSAAARIEHIYTTVLTERPWRHKDY